MLLAALLRSGRGPRPLTFLAAILVFSGIFAMLRSRIPTQIDLSETNAICEEGYEEWCDTEMGHALGLLVHSDKERDVMYPTNTATSLSARDYRTMEALYELEPGTRIVR